MIKRRSLLFVLACLLITQSAHQAKAMASAMEIKRGVNILGAFSYAIIGGYLLRDAIINGTAKRAEKATQEKRKSYVEKVLKVAQENNFELSKEEAEKKAIEAIPMIVTPIDSPARISIGLSGIAFCVASLWCMKNAYQYTQFMPIARLFDDILSNKAA